MAAVDFSFSRFTIAQLKAAGVALVIRYLTGSGKAITVAELKSYLDAGIVVAFVFEILATDGTSGYASGAAHARQAGAALLALGLPTSTPVYFAADSAIANTAAALPYWQGIASVRPPATSGVYGEGALCQALHAAGLAAWYWQSESTSFPGNQSTLPITHIQQKVNGAPLSGTDLDLLLEPDVGQYPRPAAPTPKPAPAPPLVPVHYPEDSMQAIPLSILVKGGRGWIPSPVPAGKVVSVAVYTSNPDVSGQYSVVPAAWAIAGQTGLHTPNGAVVVAGMVPDGTYGVTLWAVD